MIVALLNASIPSVQGMKKKKPATRQEGAVQKLVRITMKIF